MIDHAAEDIIEGRDDAGRKGGMTRGHIEGWEEDDAGGWMDGWMNGVLGHFYALSRLNWTG